VEVANDELYDTMHNQMTDAETSGWPIDPASTVGAIALLDGKSLPITFAKVRHTQCKEECGCIHIYMIRHIHENAIHLDLPNNEMIYITGTVIKLTVGSLNDYRVARPPLPQPVLTSLASAC